MGKRLPFAPRERGAKEKVVISFAAYTVLVATGLVREFPVKGGSFEFTSILAEKIDDVQADVADSKREVGEKVSVLNNNLQSINNRIDNIMTNINFSSTNVSQSLTNDLPGLFCVLLVAIKEARLEGSANHGISTKLNPSFWKRKLY